MEGEGGEGVGLEDAFEALAEAVAVFAVFGEELEGLDAVVEL